MKHYLNANEQKAVSEFVGLLRRHHPQRVLQTVLFGSKARGDSRPWSDIDVLVVVDQESWQLRHAISDLAADVSLEYDVLLGPRVIGQERWEQMKREGFSLYRNIAQEGIPLMPTGA